MQVRAWLIVPLLAVLSVSPAGADPVTVSPRASGTISPVVITYSYSNLLDGSFLLLTPNELRTATEEALALWARYAPIYFIELVDAGPPPSDVPYPKADAPEIRIGHHSMVDIAHSFYADEPSGLARDIHVDSGIPWTLGTGHWNILEALVHELGHALGLQHELDRPAIMNPSFPLQRYGGLGTAFLFPADIEHLQAIYGAGAGTLQTISATPEPGALALVTTGFAALAGAARMQRFRRSLCERTRRRLSGFR
jgi:matrixin